MSKLIKSIKLFGKGKGKGYSMQLKKPLKTKKDCDQLEKELENKAK